MLNVCAGARCGFTGIAGMIGEFVVICVAGIVGTSLAISVVGRRRFCA